MTTNQVLALGRELASKFEDTDTLGRWMSHYLSAMLDEADEAPEAESAEVRRRCAELVLEVWSHRSVFPFNTAPMSSYDAVLRALERIDPDASPWLAHGGPNAASLDSVGEAAALAIALERSTMKVVAFVLGKAASLADVLESDWLGLTSEIEDQDSRMVETFRRRLPHSQSADEVIDQAIARLETARTLLQHPTGVLPEE
ncbi:hypothetical protein E3T37_16170 [Cryobacterium sp. TMT2-10]|uniref:hypothetical protein n=1 Tax=Cryobacterium sp. TMT2-10 TaxID=1259244 RepID=UPI00106B468B|nr:hypothetical protein [Cryobacterium sp. TMT2-10]TFD34991.1 hypothetical protein E3T37_16170 [Cryobacterium sp. TMT2-10]